MGKNKLQKLGAIRVRWWGENFLLSRGRGRGGVLWGGHGTAERSEDTKKNKQNDCTQKAARAVVVEGGQRDGGVPGVTTKDAGKKENPGGGCTRRARLSRSTGLGCTCPPQLLQVCKHLVDPGVVLQASLEDDM